MTEHEPITVRPASLVDAAMVHRQMPEVEPEYIGDHYDTEALASKRLCVLVGQVGDVAAGYMIGYDTPDSVHIWLAGTIPMYRGQGVFRAMLQGLARDATQHDHNRLTVETDERCALLIGVLAAAGFARVESGGDATGDSVRLAKTLD